MAASDTIVACPHLAQDPIPSFITQMRQSLLAKGETDAVIHLPLQKHRQTFILLHGRGSSAKIFSTDLLSSITTNNETIRSAFPHAKFIFPNALAMEPSIFKGTQTRDSHPLLVHSRVFSDAQRKRSTPVLVRQWYDHWFDPDYLDPSLAVAAGLHASCSYMHELLQQEIQIIGKDNVVLWGSRQGASVALSTLLTWEKKAFAAVVGMSGWLPFDKSVWNYANGNDSDIPYHDPWFGQDTYWEKENDDDADYDWPTKAAKYFRFELYLQEKKGEVFKEIPVFLGQVKQDAVPVTRTAKCLDTIGADIRTVEYDDSFSVHGYSPQMLDDIVTFLRHQLQEKSKN
jgi:predicted esterase